MDSYGKSIAFLLLSVILWIVVDQQQKDIGILMTIAICGIGMASAMRYLQPVIQFMWELSVLGGTEENVLEYLVRAAGIGLLAELTGKLCVDAGNGSVAGMARFVGSTAILSCGLPVFRSLISLIQEIMGVI